MRKLLLVILCILLEPIVSRRSGGLGGLGSRGNSGARGSSGGSSSGSFSSGGRGVGVPSGGFNQPKSGFGGYPARSSFSSSGMGSAVRGSAFKSALAGAAIGGLAGVAVGGLIAHATSPFMWGGHNYYWGPEYYRHTDGQFMCSMTLDNLIKSTGTVTTTTGAPNDNTTNAVNSDTFLESLRFSNGTRPKSIVWSCRSESEVCCGTECCPNPQASSLTGGQIAGIIIGVLLIILLISCCCCFLVYRLCRKTFDRFLSTRSDSYTDKYDDYNAPQQNYPGEHSNQGHPMQPYPSQQQPSYGYPPQPQSYTPNVYPLYPQPTKY